MFSKNTCPENVFVLHKTFNATQVITLLEIFVRIHTF